MSFKILNNVIIFYIQKILTIKQILSISSEIERILYLLLVVMNKGEEGEGGGGGGGVGSGKLSFALAAL